eukprot:TRINITY_DN2554_c0_g2_i1.p1 TRINITY_DN2554_c0_g2~~TRINITY_DN2554_c0_g2_i1.p1  ORF type:complete len:281 (+),score=50.97 TRINITY_DN2554_c0_g2_i1:159-1001(+)
MSSPDQHFQAAGAEKNGAIKRILSEWKSMQKDENKYGYQAKPSEEDIFEWHFMFHGPPGTDFSGGVYTGRINLPGEYPFKPPEIRILTPNGRFELNTKICLSISNYHPEHWQPSWDIRTIITALIAFMPSEGGGAIGALDHPSELRRKLAISSHQFVHPMFDTKEFLSKVAMPTELPDIDVKAGNVSATPDAKPQQQPAVPLTAAQNVTAAEALEGEEEEEAHPLDGPRPPSPTSQTAAASPPVDLVPEQQSGNRFGLLEALAVLLAAVLAALIFRKYAM